MDKWRDYAPRYRCGMAVVFLAMLTGCSGLPKVQAWEKGLLAKPSMALDRDPLETKLSLHLYQSKEGASGGEGVGGGGCGCN